MATRDELVVAVCERYANSERDEKTRILDEFVAVTGLHRKHTMRVLRGEQTTRGAPRPARRLYDEAVRSDKAILRTTPVLLGLFSIVTHWTHDLSRSRKLKPRTAAWYPKAVLTFSDVIAAVRRECRRSCPNSPSKPACTPVTS
jgi:hypothetical protein